MPIFSRFDADKRVVSMTPNPKLLKLFEDVIPMGTVLLRKQFHESYLPKYEHGRITINGKVFSIRPAWTDFKGSPKTHIIIIGHILLCHIFERESIIYQPSTRLYTDSLETRLDQFRTLLDRVNANKYTPPSLVKKKITA